MEGVYCVGRRSFGSVSLSLHSAQDDIDTAKYKELKVKKLHNSFLLWLSRKGVWGEPLFGLQRAVPPSKSFV